MELHNETAAAAEAPQLPAYVLSDEALLSLSEITPYSEGDNYLWYVEEGKPVGGFWSIAEEVAKATAADAAQISSGQGRALLAMRAFYFLGVLRGGEAYRRLVAPEEEDEKLIDLPFTVYSELFAEDLEAMPPEWMARLLALLGLTVPWAAEDKKGGPKA